MKPLPALMTPFPKIPSTNEAAIGANKGARNPHCFFISRFNTSEFLSDFMILILLLLTVAEWFSCVYIFCSCTTSTNFSFKG